jgi:hypothetical protein
VNDGGVDNSQFLNEIFHKSTLRVFAFCLSCNVFYCDHLYLNMASKAVQILHHLARTARPSGRRRNPLRLAQQSRCFSVSRVRHIMEMSGFTPEQLDVRTAISKICSKYPNVRMVCTLLFVLELTIARNIGHSMMNLASILTTCTPISLQMVGLGSLYLKS